ncbi:MAG: hypothetical protein FWB86_08065 [Treponema sp.]|nr:hypothetical protein [Treponema sp.]MCL2251938.1 hypothetical protein [Treponema sp.]
MTLKDFKNILKEDEISCDYFLRIHYCVEELSRRLLLIGLRMYGIQFKYAREVSENFYDSDKNRFFSALYKLCGLDYEELNSFGNYKELEHLMLKFSSKHRNRLLHGVALEYSDNDLLKLLITIDKCFIEEVFSFLKHKGKPSIFEKPKEWKAPRGKKMERTEIENTVKKLFGKKLPAQSEYNKASASAMLKKMNLDENQMKCKSVY